MEKYTISVTNGVRVGTGWKCVELQHRAKCYMKWSTTLSMNVVETSLGEVLVRQGRHTLKGGSM